MLFQKVVLATPIMVIMKTEMRTFNNNRIKGNVGYFKLYFAA